MDIGVFLAIVIFLAFVGHTFADFGATEAKVRASLAKDKHDET